MVAVPAAIPVTTPLAGSIVAIPDALLLQVPLTVGVSVIVMLFPAHRLTEPEG